MMDPETARVIEAYRRLDERMRQETPFFAHRDRFHIVRLHERYLSTLNLLYQHGLRQLGDLNILDIGCGNGEMLRQFIQWGANPEKLAGIELRDDAVQMGRYLSPNIDLRSGSAVDLPWADHSFDLVCQHTVFTSILDSLIKQRVAAEMLRVLKPGGAILWYDFMYNNPANPDVRRIKAGEIGSLFQDCEVHLKKITLAPPIGRRIPGGLLPILYPLFASLSVLRTHYVGLLLKPPSSMNG